MGHHYAHLDLLIIKIRTHVHKDNDVDNNIKGENETLAWIITTFIDTIIIVADILWKNDFT